MIESILRLAKKECARSEHHIFKHAAFVIKGGSIVSSGYNHGHTHAEYHALNKLWPNKRKNVIIWSIRLTRTGKVSNAKPCPKCEKYLRENGVKTVFYSTTDGEIKKMKYV